MKLKYKPKNSPIPIKSYKISTTEKPRLKKLNCKNSINTAKNTNKLKSINIFMRGNEKTIIKPNKKKTTICENLS